MKSDTPAHFQDVLYQSVFNCRSKLGIVHKKNVIWPSDHHWDKSDQFVLKGQIRVCCILQCLLGIRLFFPLKPTLVVLMTKQRVWLCYQVDLVWLIMYRGCFFLSKFHLKHVFGCHRYAWYMLRLLNVILMPCTSDRNIAFMSPRSRVSLIASLESGRLQTFYSISFQLSEHALTNKHPLRRKKQ